MKSKIPSNEAWVKTRQHKAKDNPDYFLYSIIRNDQHESGKQSQHDYHSEADRRVGLER